MNCTYSYHIKWSKNNTKTLRQFKKLKLDWQWKFWQISYIKRPFVQYKWLKVNDICCLTIPYIDNSVIMISFLVDYFAADVLSDICLSVTISQSLCVRCIQLILASLGSCSLAWWLEHYVAHQCIWYVSCLFFIISCKDDEWCPQQGTIIDRYCSRYTGPFGCIVTFGTSKRGLGGLFFICGNCNFHFITERIRLNTYSAQWL